VTTATPRTLEASGTTLRRVLLFSASALMVLAIFLPLWGMTLVSVQYPEGLRLLVYPTHIRGDITEINLLNHYIGMAEISNDYFVELKVIPALFLAAAAACHVAALIRRRWATLLPLAVMAGAAAYGFWSMTTRLHDYGTNLDPTAAMKIEPFTPPMFGENVIAQFGTYSYFSWGTFLPMVAGALVTLVLVLDLRARRVEG